MVKLKTVPTDADPAAFLDAVPDGRRRDDARAVAAMLAEATGDEPVMWGDSIVGYGRRHLRYASGRELDWFRAGFSPRAASLTLYLPDAPDSHRDLLDRLGPHRTGVGCLYLTRLDRVDTDVLRELVERTLHVAEGTQGD
jgi:hypothetical protein